MEKKLIMASDPSGLTLKEEVKAHLESQGYQIKDVGTTLEKQVMFYDAARNAAEAVSRGEFKRGIVFCGTGMGVALIANKYHGVYCAPCENVQAANRARVINNCNMLAMGGNVTSLEDGKKIAEEFLSTDWMEDTDEATNAILQAGYRVMESL